MGAVPVTIVGTAYYTDLSVGGGPLPGGPPLGIWGPGGPWPTPPIHIPPAQPPGVVSPPIYLPPGGGGQPPLGIWGGGNVPMPTPPIYLPPGTLPGTPEPPIYIPPG